MIFSKRQSQQFNARKIRCQEILRKMAKLLDSWFYRFQYPGSPPEIIRILGSGDAELKEKIELLQKNKYHFSDSLDNVIRQLKQGDEISAEIRTERMIQECKIFFDSS